MTDNKKRHKEIVGPSPFENFNSLRETVASEPILREVLVEGETCIWCTTQFLEKRIDVLYFTSHRLIWDLRYRGTIHKTLRYEDLPYRAILSFDKREFGTLRRLVSIGELGDLVINSVVGERTFRIQGGVGRSDDLFTAFRLLRANIVGM